MIKQMIELRRQAAHARCRITAWKCTKKQVREICRDMSSEFQTLDDIEIRPENVHMLLGARVLLREEVA